MKRSLVATLIVIIIGYLIGSRNRHEITELHAQLGKLTSQASALGLPIKSSPALLPHQRPKRPDENKLSTADIISFATKAHALEKADGNQEQYEALRLPYFFRLTELSPTELKALIIELRASAELDPEIRKRAISDVIGMLVQEHPRDSITMFTEFPEFHQQYPSMLPSTLSYLAKLDPLGAVEWLEANQAKFPGLASPDTKVWLLSSAAAYNPALSLQLLQRLPLDFPNDVIGEAIRSVQSPSDRDLTLAAFRKFLASTPDPEQRSIFQQIGFRSFLTNASRDGFEAASQWIETAGFSSGEIETMVKFGFSDGVESDDMGKWISWLNDKLPPEKSSTPIGDTVSTWTRNDFKAVDQWLTLVPEGSLKNIAVRSYAETLAPHEPETAAQWAITLPPGEARDQTLREIHQSWLKADPAAASAFAKTHGIQ
jgi:hypothetical protein